jgi:hypothetical protein
LAFLSALPINEAAGTLFAEVLFGDGTAIKQLTEDGHDAGLVVEPAEEGIALHAIVEAEVECVAHGARKTGDFTVTGRVGGELWFHPRTEGEGRTERMKDEKRKRGI